MLSRRSFLRNTALAAGASQLAPLSALAADRSGYKALVCVFFFGGFDSHDFLIGYDQPSYDSWAAARQAILDQFSETETPGARSRESLLALEPQNAANFGSRRFAMPPEAAPLKGLFDQGRLAIVPNVGPLIEPTTRTEMDNGTVQVPSRLQSHNDQQSTWQAFTGEGARAGWGGLVLDAVEQSSPYAAVSLRGNSVFLTGQETRQLQVSSSGSISTVYGSNGSIFGSEEAAAKLMAYYANAANGANSVMMRDIINLQAKAIEDTGNLAGVLEAQTIGDTIRIEGNRLSDQLATIADMISARNTLGVNRQVFFASAGGFDTHNDHAFRVPGLISNFSQAMASFQSAIDAAGLSDQVTLFTASDFGRTLTANATGTDHGWGGHQIVMGGAVRGGSIYGEVPPYETGHEQDLRRGSMIPQISVDQYGADLSRWFGLTESELDLVFANRRNFDLNNLGIFA